MEISAVISGLKATGPGLDKIYGKHITLICPVILPILSHVFNLVFKTGVFPCVFKLAKVVPAFKKGDPIQIENYRPISVLPFLDKVLEKLIERRLSNYCKKFYILTPSQLGFRPGISTDKALACFVNSIKLFIDKGNYTGSVFVNLSKAFDSIDHNILFTKLELYGIAGPLLLLLKSFLFDRQHIVSVNGTYSSSTYTRKGVPQGSVLGPLLFLTYVNDLPQCLTHSKCILYADDTTIFSEYPGVEVLTSDL